MDFAEKTDEEEEIDKFDEALSQYQSKESSSNTGTSSVRVPNNLTVKTPSFGK